MNQTVINAFMFWTAMGLIVISLLSVAFAVADKFVKRREKLK